MRILFLNPGAGLGGAERALLQMVASMREEWPELEPHVLIGERGALAEKFEHLGVSHTVIPLPATLGRIGDAGAGGPSGRQLSRAGVMFRLGCAAPLFMAYIQQLHAAIRRIMPNIVHSNGLKMHLLGASAMPRPIPLVWHLHDFVGLRPLMPWLLKFNVHRCAAMIANSRSVADDARKVFGDKCLVQTVYNGVDLSDFAPQGRRLDLDSLAGMAPASSSVVRIGLIATMARWKGHEVLLRALAMLPKEGIRAYIIGGPIYRTLASQYSLAELQRMACALGIAERVGFTGFISDTAAAMRALDIVVHASVAPEPFGLSVAEAFACGRAVVASRSGGVLEMIRENENALLHIPGDEYGLAAALNRLCGDQGLRLRLGTAARQTAESFFSRDRLACDLRRVYRIVSTGKCAGSVFERKAFN